MMIISVILTYKLNYYLKLMTAKMYMFLLIIIFMLHDLQYIAIQCLFYVA